MSDPNFDGTVVLVLDHTEDGAVGVVLNRPSETEVGDALPGWASTAAPPPVFYAGGPVAPTGAIALGRAGDGAEPDGWTAVLGRVGLVPIGDAGDPPAAGIDAVRIFAGHAGWIASQLEGEIDAGGWIVVDAEPDDAFTRDPPDLRRAVLARQRGRLAWFANCPPDPRVN
jgi:putative transcriptional regulator